MSGRTNSDDLAPKQGGIELAQKFPGVPAGLGVVDQSQGGLSAARAAKAWSASAQGRGEWPRRCSIGLARDWRSL